MSLIIGPVRVGIQSGGKFNFGKVFLATNKNNLHITGGVSSFNQGSKNIQKSFFNAPELKFENVSADIIANSGYSNLWEVKNKT